MSEGGKVEGQADNVPASCTKACGGWAGREISSGRTTRILEGVGPRWQLDVLQRRVLVSLWSGGRRAGDLLYRPSRSCEPGGGPFVHVGGIELGDVDGGAEDGELGALHGAQRGAVEEDAQVAVDGVRLEVGQGRQVGGRRPGAARSLTHTEPCLAHWESGPAAASKGDGLYSAGDCQGRTSTPLLSSSFSSWRMWPSMAAFWRLQLLEVAASLGAAGDAVRDVALEVLGGTVGAALGERIAADLADLAGGVSEKQPNRAGRG